MSQLRTVKNRAKLHELTHLRAILPNQTRWTGKFDMVKRFTRIEALVQSIPSLDSYLPTLDERRILKAALPLFENFNSVAINLQKKGLNTVSYTHLTLPTIYSV